MSFFSRHGLTAAIAILIVYLVAVDWPESRTNAAARLDSLRTSFCYTLLAWTVVAVILLGIYLVSSLEETRSILRAALLSSVPAMWFVPALLLVSTPSPVLNSIGLLLIANSVRVLLIRSLSRWDHLSEVRRRKTAQLFSYSRISSGSSRQTVAVVLGALTFQMGIAAIYLDYGLTSVALFATGAAVWTLAAISRGVCQPRKRVDSPMRALLTLILALVISAPQISSKAPSVTDLQFPEMTQFTFQPLLRKPPKKNVTHVLTQSKPIPPASHMVVDGVEGVILRPEIVPPRLTVHVSRKSSHQNTSFSPGFQFTGEYRLFPKASRDLKKDWSIQKGTPVDTVYATIRGSALQTEAYQPLDPPLDFTRLRTLQLTLISHEGMPGAVTVQLIGNRRVPDLGPEIFGLDKAPEELVEFAVPESLAGLQVTGIRIVFSCIATECSQSLRVAVKGFGFLSAKS